MNREWARKDIIELLVGIIILPILMTVIVITYTCLHESYTESSNKTANLKAYCDSISGNLGGDKCYKDGKEMLFRGEEY